MWFKVSLSIDTGIQTCCKLWKIKNFPSTFCSHDIYFEILVSETFVFTRGMKRGFRFQVIFRLSVTSLWHKRRPNYRIRTCTHIFSHSSPRLSKEHILLKHIFIRNYVEINLWHWNLNNYNVSRRVRHDAMI